MTTQTPTLPDIRDYERVSLTPAGYAAGREQDACAVLCAMLTNPDSGAHYRALRRACRNVSGEDVITTARLLAYLRDRRMYFSADDLSRILLRKLAERFDGDLLPIGYTFGSLYDYSANLRNLDAPTWAALYELATAALVWDRAGALAF